MRLDGNRVIIIGGSSGIGLETARLALAERASVTIAGRSVKHCDGRPRAWSLQASLIGFAPSSLTSLKNRRSRRCSPARRGSIMCSCQPGNSGRQEATRWPPSSKGCDRSWRFACSALLASYGRRSRGWRVARSPDVRTLLNTPGKGRSDCRRGRRGRGGNDEGTGVGSSPIRVNAVAPGLIDTPLWDSFGPQRDAFAERAAKLPVGRMGRPDEVAEAVLFLMTNGFVTGTVLTIDGGGGLV